MCCNIKTCPKLQKFETRTTHYHPSVRVVTFRETEDSKSLLFVDSMIRRVLVLNVAHMERFRLRTISAVDDGTVCEACEIFDGKVAFSWARALGEGSDAIYATTANVELHTSKRKGLQGLQGPEEGAECQGKGTQGNGGGRRRKTAVFHS